MGGGRALCHNFIWDLGTRACNVPNRPGYLQTPAHSLLILCTLCQHTPPHSLMLPGDRGGLNSWAWAPPSAKAASTPHYICTIPPAAGTAPHAQDRRDRAGRHRACHCRGQPSMCCGSVRTRKIGRRFCRRRSLPRWWRDAAAFNRLPLRLRRTTTRRTLAQHATAFAFTRLTRAVTYFCGHCRLAGRLTTYIQAVCTRRGRWRGC